MLWRDRWLNDLSEREIPTTGGVDPLKVMASDLMIAKWNDEGLPSDRVRKG